MLGARNVVLRSRHARCTVGKPREIMVGDGVISFTVVDIEPQIGCVVALYAAYVGYARAVALCAFFSCWWPQGPRV